MSDRCIYVRFQQNETDTESHNRQDNPANETKEQPEQVHLVAIHHAHGFLYGSISGDGGIILQDERSHRIREGLDDAGDDEQQHPQNHIDVVQQIGSADALPLSILVTVENRVPINLFFTNDVKEEHGESPQEWEAQNCPKERGTAAACNRRRERKRNDLTYADGDD